MFDDFYDEDSEGAAIAEDPEEESAVPESLPQPRENPDLFGHERTESAILSLFNDGRLPHAMIFAGPAGVGKETAAFRVARFLLKHGGADAGQDSLFGDAPPAPESLYVSSDDSVFKKVASGGHPDLRFFERPLDEKRGVKKGAVDLDSVRKIAPFLRMSASEGGWRVVIVDEADLMRKEAQNALLKILEEPPANALLVLVCNRPGALIPTIRSRCRLYHFSPLPEAQITPLLRRIAPSLSVEDMSLLSALADGSPGRAALLQGEGGIESLKAVLALLSDPGGLDWPKVHHLAETLSRADAEKAYEGFAFVTEWLARTVLRIKAAPGTPIPPILAASGMIEACSHISLAQWTEICEKLTDHFAAIHTATLDKRHGVLGAFAILTGAVK